MEATLKRDTAETSVEVSLRLDGTGKGSIDTGIVLLDEMLSKLADASGFDLAVSARGDLATGDHHTVEDVAITLGSALAESVIKGIGSSTVPSGNGFAMAAIRFGEPGYSEDFAFRAQEMDEIQLENISHFMRSFAYNGNFTLHLTATGDDDHLKIGALIVALGRALGKAAKDGADGSIKKKR
jgi:imidazoleglycerol-phosphate dehydratase